MIDIHEFVFEDDPRSLGEDAHVVAILRRVRGWSTRLVTTSRPMALTGVSGDPLDAVLMTG